MLEEVLKAAARLEVIINKNMSKDYIDCIYKAVDLGYLIETKNGYRITETGRSYLDGLLLINPLIKEDIKRPTIVDQKRIGSFKKWLKQISIKSIIEMIIAAVIAAGIIYWLHLNAVRTK